MNEEARRVGWSRPDWVWIALSVFLSVSVPLAALPTAEAGFDDDWSYSRMAFDVAATGHFHLDGWATASIGPHAYWGAAFVLLFGKSYFVLRCSVLVLAGATAVALYVIARRCGLPRPYAFLVAAISMLSPIVVPLSASFMTDVPAWFCALLAVLSLSNMSSSGHAGRRAPWFVAAVGLMLIGGAVRQVVWTNLLVLPPLALCLVPLPRRSMGACLAAWLAAIGYMAWSIRQTAATPYAVTDPIGATLLAAAQAPARVLAYAVRTTATLSLLLLPTLAGLTWRWDRKVARQWVLALVAAAALAGLLTLCEHSPKHLVRPWLGNTFTTDGILFPSTEIPGESVQYQSSSAWVLLALAAWAVAGRAVVWVIQSMRTIVVRCRQVRDWPSDLVLAALLALSAALMIGLASLRRGVYDRYMLVAIPPLAIFLSRSMVVHRPQSPRVPYAIGVAVWALAAWVYTFDYHAELKARVEGVALLQRAGAPRNHISAGLELDADEQLNEWGYMNDARIQNPPDAYLPTDFNPDWPTGVYWFWKRTPAIVPEYLVAAAPFAKYSETRAGAISYFTPLYPFERKLYLIRRHDLTIKPLIADPQVLERHPRRDRTPGVAAGLATRPANEPGEP